MASTAAQVSLEFQCRSPAAGGPWPSTTNGAHTSVGATAVRRWQRPVCYQSVPAALLLTALRDGNPWRLPRRIDGVFE